jgi:putative acetyltransferase
MSTTTERTTVLRTTSDDTRFRYLVAKLDQDLARRNGDSNAFFAQFNGVDRIHHVVVVLRDGEPVGCGAFKPFDQDTVELKRMYTAPEHRQTGIGSKVVNELEQWAGELGYTRCVLETGKKMTEAIALYTKRGFTSIPNYGPYVGVLESTCFEKRRV